MKPKLLKIEGLNSFQEQQIIDFDTLMEKGLFGIFGATGSGKSTILDAVILVLYGGTAIDRKNFINSDLNLAKIYFEFELNNKTYTIQRVFQTSKSGGCECTSARIDEKDSKNDMTILADKSNSVTKQAEELIGLNSNDFTRTVVLPQGKFSEFLTLTPANRNEMLERIFHLEEYGGELVKKIKEEKTTVNKELDALKVEISTYGKLTEENLTEEKNKCQLLKDKITILKQEQIDTQKEYDVTKNIWELQKEKTLYQTKLDEISQYKENIQSQKENLKLSTKADIVYPYIKSLEETENKLNNINVDFETNTITHNDISVQLEQKQKRYNTAKEIKSKEYEPLLKKEANLKQAIDILDKVNILEKEKSHLQKEYYKYSQIYESLKSEEEEVCKNIYDNKADLKLLLEHKENLNIDSEYREEIEKAYQYETKHNDISQHIEEISKKIKKYEISIENADKENVEIQQKLDSIKYEISELTQELDRLDKNNFGDMTTLLDLQNECNQISVDYKDVKSKEHKKAILQKELAEINKLIQQYTTEFDTKSEQLNHNLQQQRQLKKELEALEIINQSSILAEVLEENKPCPVCGSTHHPNPAKIVDSNVILLLSQKVESVETEAIEIQNDINRLSTEIKLETKNVKKITVELSDITQELEYKTSTQLEKEQNELNQKFENLKDEIKQWNIRKNMLNDSLEEKKATESKLNINLTRIIEGQTKDKYNRQEQEAEQKEYIQQQSNLNEILTSFIKKLNINNFQNEINKILSNEKKRLELEKSEKQLRDSLNLYEQQKEKLITQISNVEKKTGELNEISKEKANTIKSHNDDIKTLSENNNPEEYIFIVGARLKEICELEQTLAIELEDMKSKKQEFTNICMSLEKQKETFEQLQSDQNVELTKSLNENGFVEVDTVKASLIPKDRQNTLSDMVTEYEENYRNIADNIDRLTKRLDGRRIEQAYWENINLQLKQVSNQLEQITQETAVSSERISIMEQKLKEIHRLNKLSNKSQHRMDLLKELLLVTKGNEFVKFVSKRQIKYITKEASKYLKIMSRDRFLIEIDDDNDFIMQDNFLGGVRRRPDTLSGGEIFITSLSLALALSSQIQLKNKAPLEFFFLDEGFGNLDIELVDTVIGALEKLHSEHMHIGIISHVEELKERVPSKLMITPAQQGLSGSKVNLELT